MDGAVVVDTLYFDTVVAVIYYLLNNIAYHPFCQLFADFLYIVCRKHTEGQNTEVESRCR